MSEYKWNSGGTFNGADWNGDKLPTDAELVMNCVSAYLDTRLVPRTRTVLSLTGSSVAASARPFTGTYYQTMTQYLAEESRAAATALTETGKKKEEDKNSSSFLAKLSPDVRALIALSPKKSSAGEGRKLGFLSYLDKKYQRELSF